MLSGGLKNLGLRLSWWILSQKSPGNCCLFLFLVSFMAVEGMFPVKGMAQVVLEPDFYFTGTRMPYFLPTWFFRQPLDSYSKGVNVGPVRLRPALGIAQAYYDNVFATKTNRQGDFMTMIAPSVQVDLPFGGTHRLMVDYQLAKRFNYRFSENNGFNQQAMGILNLKFLDGLTFDLQGGHATGFDQRGGVVDLQFGDLTTWNTNLLLGEAGFMGQWLGAKLRFSSVKWNFENNQQDLPRNRLENSINLFTFLKATPKTYAIVGFSLAQNTFEFNKQLDSFAYTLNAGFHVPVADRLTGTLLVGFTVLNFDRAPLDQPPDDPRLSPGGTSQQLVSVIGDLRWTPTTRLNVHFRPSRSISQLAVFDASTVVQTGGFLIITQALTDRWGLWGNVNYNHIEFTGLDDRTDQIYTMGIGMQYRTVERLGFRFGYIFMGRSSTEDRFDYYSNGVMLSVEAIL